MEHFFPQIQVKTKKKGLQQLQNFPQFYAQMCTHSNYWGGYSQIIREIYPPISPFFRHPWFDFTLYH